MRIRIPVSTALLCAATLAGQHHFSWQDACFNNPALPYCPGHEYAVKPTPKEKPTPNLLISPGFTPSHEAATPSVIVVGAVDWRFADPSADELLEFNVSRFSNSSLARGLIERLGASQDRSEADAPKVFNALSGVTRVALSVRDGRRVLMITGAAKGPAPSTLAAGWKTLPVAGGMLMGDAEGVDQAALRIATGAPLTDLARMAEQQADSDFIAVGAAQRLGQDAVLAGIKDYSLSASFQDRFLGHAAFEFSGTADSEKLRRWAATLGGAIIDEHAVRVEMSLEADAVPAEFAGISSSFLGQRMALLVNAARYLPENEAAVVNRTRPVIYGLDDGPKELK